MSIAVLKAGMQTTIQASPRMCWPSHCSRRLATSRRRPSRTMWRSGVAGGAAGEVLDGLSGSTQGTTRNEARGTRDQQRPNQQGRDLGACLGKSEDIINKQIDILTQILSFEKEAIDLIQEELIK